MTQEIQTLEWKTYAEWESLDYQVQRGEKATWFDGIPKFSKEQVKGVTDYYPEAGSAWDWYKD